MENTKLINTFIYQYTDIHLMENMNIMKIYIKFQIYQTEIEKKYTELSTEKEIIVPKDIFIVLKETLI